MKRNFTEIQSATQRDLNKLRNEVSSTSNDMVATCSSMLANTAQSVISGVGSISIVTFRIYQLETGMRVLLTIDGFFLSIQKQQEMKKENHELQSRLNKLKTDYDNALEQIKQKDDKIQQISKEVQVLVSFLIGFKY